MLTSRNYTKNDLIKQISKKTGFSKSISKKLIDDFIEIIIQNIIENRLILKNLGSFKLLKKKERLGRNPKTKKEFIISSRKSLSFLASKKLLNLFK